MDAQSNIVPFDFNTHAVRTITNNSGEPWFCAVDVCNVLGYTNSSKAVSDHCKVGGITKRYTPTESGNQEMTFINEGNLYRLIIKSRKPEAEAFEAWVMEEVLPSIRRKGYYKLDAIKTIELFGRVRRSVSHLPNSHRVAVEYVKRTTGFDVDAELGLPNKNLQPVPERLSQKIMKFIGLKVVCTRSVLVRFMKIPAAELTQLLKPMIESGAVVESHEFYREKNRREANMCCVYRLGGK